jgi:hypothetical protein
MEPRDRRQDACSKENAMLATWILSVLAAAASCGGLFASDLYGSSELGPAMRGQDLVTLCIVPWFLWFGRGVRRNSARATIGWLGCLGYLLYTYAGAAFAYRWNALFLIYVGLFSGCLFVLVRSLICLDVNQLQRCIDRGAPRWAVYVFLCFVAAVLAVSELGQIASALVNGRPPALIERSGGAGNFVYVLDLGIIVPLTLLVVRWLGWRRAWGDILSGMLLVKSAAMGMALLSMTAFAAHAGQPTEHALTLAYAILGLGGIGMSAWFLRHCHAGPCCEDSSPGLAAIMSLVACSCQQAPARR